MTIISGFSNNQSIGVSDLNAITARLLTSGIEDVYEGNGPHNISTLNGITNAVCYEGVIGDSINTCKTVNNAGIYNVLTGTAFFNDGSFIEITENETIVPTQDVTNYVYFFNSEETKTLVCSTAEPTGDYVMLAIINADGSVSDNRKYAQGKQASRYASNTGVAMKHTVNVAHENGYFQYYIRYHVEKTIDLGVNNYSMLIFKSDQGLQGYDFTNNTYCHSSISTNSIIISSSDTNTRNFTVSKNGNIITLNFYVYLKPSHNTGPFDVELLFI